MKLFSNFGSFGNNDNKFNLNENGIGKHDIHRR